MQRLAGFIHRAAAFARERMASAHAVGSLALTLFALSAACGNVAKTPNDEEIAGAILSDLKTAQQDMAYDHDFDPDAPQPEGWMTPAYLAGASSRPDVAAYFRGYLGYTAELESRFEAVADSLIDAHFGKAGLGSATEANVKTAFKRGFQRSADVRRGLFSAMRAYAQSALDLHQYLASIDADVLPGVGDNLEFEDVKQQIHALQLMRIVGIAEKNLERFQTRALADAAAIKTGRTR